MFSVKGAAGNCWRHIVQKMFTALFKSSRGKTQSEAPSPINAVKEESSFQVDLRDHGVSQDDVYKDEERMTEMQNLVDGLQDGYRDKSIIKDLKQDGVSNAFSEESKRKLFKRLAIASGTNLAKESEQCLTHSKEWTIYCGCGECLILSQEHTDEVKRIIYILAEPLYAVKRGRQGQRHGPEEWQYHHWKAVDAAQNYKK